MTIRDSAEAMYEFMGRTGAMRFDRIAGIASVARKPTAQQLTILGRSSKGGYLALSLNTPEGRIVDDTELDSASPRLIEDFFAQAQAQEKADRGVAGAWASRGKANAGSRTSEVTETLSTDPQIGASFHTLTDAGAVNVVETVDDLPTEIRSQIDDTEQSRSPMKSIEANIRRGNEAMSRALQDKTDVHQAMYRSDVGWIDFVWGAEGDAVKKNGAPKGEKGISHILEARQRKDGYSEKQALSFLADVVETIARGRTERMVEYAGSKRCAVVFDGNEVQLIKNPGNNAWVLTGFVRNSDGNRVGNDSPAPTPRAPHLPDANGGADLLSSGTRDGRHTRGLGERSSLRSDTSVTANGLQIKHSDNGDIQGLYDPASGKSYLIASNLSKDTAKGVFLHEVGVRLAAAC